MRINIPPISLENHGVYLGFKMSIQTFQQYDLMLLPCSPALLGDPCSSFEIGIFVS